jgi:hypothetical protein
MKIKTRKIQIPTLTTLLHLLHLLHFLHPLVPSPRLPLAALVNTHHVLHHPQQTEDSANNYRTATRNAHFHFLLLHLLHFSILMLPLSLLTTTLPALLARHSAPPAPSMPNLLTLIQFHLDRDSTTNVVHLMLVLEIQNETIHHIQLNISVPCLILHLPLVYSTASPIQIMCATACTQL